MTPYAHYKNTAVNIDENNAQQSCVIVEFENLIHLLRQKEIKFGKIEASRKHVDLTR